MLRSRCESACFFVAINKDSASPISEVSAVMKRMGLMSDGNVSTAISAKPQLHTLESLKKMDASEVKAAYEDIVSEYAESLKNFGYTEKQVKGYVSEALKTKTSENRISSVMRLQEEMGLGDVTLHEEQNPLQDVTFDDKIMEEKSAKLRVV